MADRQASLFKKPESPPPEPVRVLLRPEDPSYDDVTATHSETASSGIVLYWAVIGLAMIVLGIYNAVEDRMLWAVFSLSVGIFSIGCVIATAAGKMITGLCPYCNAEVKSWMKKAGRVGGVTCSTCMQRIIIRNEKFFKLSE